jgi:5-hydroxyisourate hydrolase-like protein (transthyretin family)
MIRLERLFGLALSISVCVSAAGTVQAVRPAGATIEGVVRRADTGAPVSGARVILYRLASPQESPFVLDPESGRGVSSTYKEDLWFRNPSSDAPADDPIALPPADTAATWTVTGANGLFAMTGIAPGSYRLIANADGYLAREYGQKVSRVDGTLLTLTERRTISGVSLTLVATASIEGHITEAGSDPAPGVRVHLLRDIFSKDGHRRTKRVAQAITDDRGHYRIFWIPPGQYRLAIGDPYIDPRGRSEFRFYPDVFDIAGAEYIDIQPGAARTFNWNLPAPQRFRFRARLTDSVTGMPPTEPDIYLAVKTPIEWRRLGHAGDAFRYDPMTGAIEIDDLNPGIYEVRWEGSNSWQAGAAIVRITNADVEGVVLDFAETNDDHFAPVKGKIAFAGGSRLPSFDGLTVVIDSPTRRPPTAVNVDRSPIESEVENDGAFSVNVSSDLDDELAVAIGESYSVSVRGLPQGWYVREATLNGHDVLTAEAPFRAGAQLAITLSPNAGQVEGIVKDAKGAPVAGVHAILIPVSKVRVDGYQTALTDRNGRFNVPNVPPGDYSVYAWEALEPNAYFDSRFLNRFESRGAAVHVSEKSRPTVNVTLIPAAESER